MAIETHLDRVGGIGTDLDERGPEIGVLNVEVVMTPLKILRPE
jgi:hypothetical protein